MKAVSFRPRGYDRLYLPFVAIHNQKYIYTNFAGLTPLAYAVQSKQLHAVKRLVKMGADIDSQDASGRTCLSVAAYQVKQ